MPGGTGAGRVVVALVAARAAAAQVALGRVPPAWHPRGRRWRPFIGVFRRLSCVVRSGSFVAVRDMCISVENSYETINFLTCIAGNDSY